jgi:hypothetical protein
MKKMKKWTWVANWNAMKSGSDTISKLLASVAFKMPEQNAQCHVVGRLLLLGDVVIFHGTQQLSARKGVEQTDSLFQYRKNASHCLMFPVPSISGIPGRFIVSSIWT